ncbi:MAG: VCBS repeat-containing protein, partial [Gammaproteobacteria bacterium]
IGELEDTIATLTSEASVIPDLNDEITSLEETIASLNEEIEELEILVDIKNNPIPQTIYPTALQNHEWNKGWYSRERESFPVEFFSAFEYFDYDLDGDLDIFCRVDFFPGQGGDPANTNNSLRVLIKNKNTWTVADENIIEQSGRGYRKISTVDVDNDGDLDMIAFNAEDPAEYNQYRYMGGLDLFRFEDGKFYYEELYPYQEGNIHYFHSGTAGDINNDGWVDIIAGNGNVWLNKGDGSYEETPFKLIQNDKSSWYSSEMIDVNGDGYNDLLIGKSHDDYWYFEQGGTDEMYGRTQFIYFGKSQYPYFDMDNPYTLPTNYDFYGTSELIEKGLSSTMDFAVIDFDKDGLLDIFTLSHSAIKPPHGDGTSGQINVLEYYENNGDNTFTNKSDNIFLNKSNELSDSKTNWWKVWDVDGDGNLEIILEVEEYEFTHFRKDNQGKYFRTK